MMNAGAMYVLFPDHVLPGFPALATVSPVLGPGLITMSRDFDGGCNTCCSMIEALMSY